MLSFKLVMFLSCSSMVFIILLFMKVMIICMGYFFAHFFFFFGKNFPVGAAGQFDFGARTF